MSKWYFVTIYRNEVTYERQDNEIQQGVDIQNKTRLSEGIKKTNCKITGSSYKLTCVANSDYLVGNTLLNKNSTLTTPTALYEDSGDTLTKKEHTQ